MWSSLVLAPISTHKFSRLISLHFLKKKLVERIWEKIKDWSLCNQFISSPRLCSWQSIDIVRRKIMLSIIQLCGVVKGPPNIIQGDDDVQPLTLFIYHCWQKHLYTMSTDKWYSFNIWYLQSWTRGQETWDIFAFLGCFPIHTGPTAPLTPQTMLNTCIQNFFGVWTLYRVGGRENCKKISKRMHCFKREPRNDRKIWILQYCHKNFCPGL